MSIDLGPSPSFIKADLPYYTAPANGERPYDIRYPTAGLTTNVIPNHVLGTIYDLRPLIEQGRTSETSIDVTGFQILNKIQGGTTMTEKDFESDEIIRDRYYAETIELLKRETGATRVIIFDHTLRRTILHTEGFIETQDSRQPVAKVHCDQTPASGLKRVYRHLGEDADTLLKTHCKLINVWRPLHGPVSDRPLAMIDYRSIDPDRDLIPSRLFFAPPTPEGETYQINHNDSHKWYYLNEMEKDEAILLQCWTNEKRSVVTPHTGIINTEWDGKGRLRESIEIRALCFMEDRDIESA